MGCGREDEVVVARSRHGLELPLDVCPGTLPSLVRVATRVEVDKSNPLTIIPSQTSSSNRIPFKISSQISSIISALTIFLCSSPFRTRVFTIANPESKLPAVTDPYARNYPFSMAVAKNKKFDLDR